MDLSRDAEFKKSYSKYKLIVKKWEKRFFEVNGRVPSKHDIKEAESDVRGAYARYFNLKSQLLEGALDGLLPPSPPPPRLSSSPRLDSSPPFGPSSLGDSSPRRDSPPPSTIELPTVSQIERLVATPNGALGSEGVWGEHLNNRSTLSTEKKVEKMRSSMTALPEKLFKSWSFNKRNPRKSASFKSQMKSESTDEHSGNSNATYSESQISPEVLHSETAKGSLRPSPMPNADLARPLNFAMPCNLRNLNAGWLQRCGVLENGNEEKTLGDSVDSVLVRQTVPSIEQSSYGLKNVSVDPIAFAESLDCADFIENSESESEEALNRSNYKKIRPVVKRQKISTPDTLHADKKETPEPITEMLKTEDLRETETPKRRAKKKRESVKKKVLKKSKSTKKCNPTKEENEPELIDAERVEMPRFVIDSSILKERNLVEGLTAAISQTRRSETAKTVKMPSNEDKLLKKINDGSLNDNFVRINIEKKVFVRGKKTVNFSRFKKQQWKNKKKQLNETPEFPEGGVYKCFKCGGTGHFARYCSAHKGGGLIPLEETEEKSHPTMKETEDSLRKFDVLVEESVPFRAVGDGVNFENSLPDPSNLSKSEVVPESFLKLLAAPTSVSIVSIVEPVYAPQNDSSQFTATPEVLVALERFGYQSFRNGQERAIMRVLTGLSTLLTLSTGSGKSLCYQLPAYIYAQRSKCITLVVSPLVSLMEDQVVNMPSFLRAGCLHTNQSPTQREKMMELIKDGEIDVLLISPEAIVSGERSTGFGGVLKRLPPIAFACIDEVHCVSQWSHNFRPSYLMICRVLKERLGVKCILGLTATATTSTTVSIMEHIGISDGFDGVIANVPLPENLILTVSRDDRRDRALLELLQSERFINCNSIIIYCIRRDECERVAGLIRTSLEIYKQVSQGEDQKINRKRKRFNLLVEAYHAGMSAAKRRRVQGAFMNGDLKIVVATVAFGMGINKSDIRGVIHYNMPSSFESYVQEVGRAGRDGLKAQCHVFIEKDGKDKYELLRHIHANSIERHVIRKLLQKIFIPCACKIIKTDTESISEEDKTNSERKCRGHEVAFSIDDTVKELDLPVENICTLLCYLELHTNKYIKVLSNVYTMCKIMTYGGFSPLLEAAQKCPPLAMAIALERKKGNAFENAGNFEFCVIDVAAAIGWESGIVKNHLKKLEWDNTNNKVKRSLLKVEFNTLGFHLMAPGDLDSTQLDETLDLLYERTQLQERNMLHQLHEISNTLFDISYPNIKHCFCLKGELDYTVNSDKLKKCVQDYFSRESLENKLVEIDNRPFKEDHVIADIRGLIATYKDCVFSGRAIARILHGISSPNFPAIVWGRCRYWRSHMYTDFYKISDLAKQQIMLMR